MNALTKHHDRAMDFAERADAARLRNEPVRQQEWLAKALVEELKAVAMCVRDGVPEPTFSILHRSAAALAMDCGQYRQAEKLAAGALAGQPPPEIAGELRELLARARALGTAAAEQFEMEFAKFAKSTLVLGESHLGRSEPVAKALLPFKQAHRPRRGAEGDQ